MYDESQVFYYDPASTITAYATRWGGVDNGGLVYGGCKTDGVRGLDEQRFYSPLAEQFETYAAAVAHEAIRELLEASLQARGNSLFPWKGIVKWLAGTNPNHVVAGTGAILAALIARGYTLTKETTTNPDGSKTVTVRFGPHQAGEMPEAVPPKIKDDWDAAVKAAAKYNPINGGVFPNK